MQQHYKMYVYAFGVGLRDMLCICWGWSIAGAHTIWIKQHLDLALPRLHWVLTHRVKPLLTCCPRPVVCLSLFNVSFGLFWMKDRVCSSPNILCEHLVWRWVSPCWLLSHINRCKKRQSGESGCFRQVCVCNTLHTSHSKLTWPL